MEKKHIITTDKVDDYFIDGSTNPVQSAAIKTALDDKVNKKYGSEFAGKHLVIDDAGDVALGDSGSLPEATTNGSAVVYVDGEWKTQTGYGYETTDAEGTTSVVKMDSKYIPDVYSTMATGDVYTQGSDGKAVGVSIDNLQSDSLVTTAKKIVAAINENRQVIDGITGGVRIEVVDTLPETPINNTIYYIKQAGVEPPVYTIKMYTNNTYIDLGTTQIDLSLYVKKTDIVDNLTSTATDKPLSANQGKVLNDAVAGKIAKTDLVDNVTVDDRTRPPTAHLTNWIYQNYLKKSGGTMTGKLEIKDGNGNGIGTTNNNSYVDIHGGFSNANAGSLTLFGDMYPDANSAGGFRLGATDGAGNYKWLLGNSKGVLTWGNDNILTSAHTVNNVTSTYTKSPLSANMGKWLNDNKLAKSDVINDLTTTTTTQALSANMGKTLNDNLHAIDVDNFKAQATTEAGKVFGVKADGTVGLLSGGAGVEVVDNLTTDDSTKALSAKQGKVLKGLVDAIPAHTTKYLHQIAMSNTTNEYFIAFQFANSESEDYTQRNEISDAVNDAGHYSKGTMLQASGFISAAGVNYVIVGVTSLSTNSFKFWGVPTTPSLGDVFDDIPYDFTYIVDSVTTL